MTVQAFDKASIIARHQAVENDVFLFFLYFLQRQAVRNDRVVGIALDRLKKIFLSLKKKT
jgi:hypothetical protein